MKTQIPAKQEQFDSSFILNPSLRQGDRIYILPKVIHRMAGEPQIGNPQD